MTDRQRWLLAGVAVGVIGMVIRVWLFQQPVNSDDVQYFSTASQAHSISDLVDVSQPNGMRLTVMAIPTLYGALFSPFTAFYATIYTFALLSFGSLYLFARVLSGQRAAVIAAAIWATSTVAITIDTRLTPDNLGTSLCLLGLALIGWVAFPPREGVRPPPTRPRTIALVAGAGAFLIWLAMGARESFFVFGGVAVGFALLSERRWLILGAVAGGLLAGFLVEVICMEAATGDGLIRWKAAAAYRSSVAKEGASTAIGAGGEIERSIFAGYHFSDLVLRYPRLIFDASAGEAVIFLAGLAGVGAWLVRGRDRRNLAKAGTALAAYGFLAFAIVGVDPIVVLMREKLRYYATAAPLFYLATAEWLELAVFARVGPGRLARWLDHRARPIAAVAIGGLALVANLWISSGAPELARNGSDTHWSIAARIQADAGARSRPRVLVTDGRTARVTSILMARDGAWDGRELAAVLDDGLEDAYVLLDWKRLNANVDHHYGAAPQTHQAYRFLDDHALVGRTVRGPNQIDVFYVGAAPLTRAVEPIDEAFPGDWSVICGAGKTWSPATAGVDMCPGEALYLYDGDGAPWRPRPAGLTGDRFLRVEIDAEAADATTLRGYLTWWPSHAARPVRQAMGTVEVSPGSQRYVMWTFVPQAAESYRVVLRGEDGITVRDVRSSLLARDPRDDVRPLGDAWPARPIRDARLDAIAAVIRADAKAHDRPLVVRADRLTAETGQRTLDDAWAWDVLGGAAVEPGYVIVDHARAAPGDALLDHAAVVARSADDEALIDVFYVDATSPTRGREPLDTGFPDAWSRLVGAGDKEASDVAAGTAVTFTDPDQELVYSGPGEVWRAPDGGAGLEGDQFVELTGLARDEDGGTLRGLLYWWPQGASKPIHQEMGTATLDADPRPIALWTYLPRDAVAYRVVLRAAAGAEVSGVQLSTLDRDGSDEIAKIGAPW